MADPRSGLWSHVARLLDAFRPRWFVGENVPGLLSVNGGRDFGVVLQDLADIGYGFSWRVLDARWFGVPQRRRRVILVGHLGDTGAAPAQVLFEPESVHRDSAQSRTARASVAQSARDGAPIAFGHTNGIDPQFSSGVYPTVRVGGMPSVASVAYVADHVSTLQASGGDRGYRVDAEGAAGGHLVAYPLAVRGRDGGAELEIGQPGDPMFALRAGDGGSSRSQLVAVHENQRGELTVSETAGALKTGGGKPGQGYPAITDGVIVRRLTPLECERLQGFPDGWTDLDGTSDSQRYKQMGNSVAVPVLEWVLRRLVAVDRQLAERAA